jgi:hypothetical protein
VNLADAIPIVIAGPLFSPVANCGMRTNDVIVALPFIGIDDSSSLGEGVNVFFQSFSVGMMDYSQPHLPAITAYSPNDRGAVIIVSAVSTLFIGPTARWIFWIRVIVTFFPPRSETSRPFQSVHHLRGSGVGGVEHWLEVRGVPQALFAD